MKLLFIAVSVVALVYLLLQSNLISNFTHSASANEAVATAQKGTPDHVLNTQHLEARVSELTASNKHLQVQLDKLAQQVVDMQMTSLTPSTESTESNELEQSASVTGVVEQEIVSQSTDAYNTASASDNQQDEHQKRLQQQAVLRDLAQKMELSALAGLSS